MRIQILLLAAAAALAALWLPPDQKVEVAPGVLLIPPIVRSASAETPAREVFIFSGQSNMQGYGPVGGLPMASSDSGTMYPPTSFFEGNTISNYINDGSYLCPAWGNGVVISPCYNPPGKVGGKPTEASFFGPEYAFLVRYRKAHPTTPLAVIKNAMGGTGIDQWTAPNGGLWNGIMKPMLTQAKARLDAAGKPYNWNAMLWLQGENNISLLGVGSDTQFTTKTRNMIAAIRAITGPSLKVGIGRISNSMEFPHVVDCKVAESRASVQKVIDAVEWIRTQQVTVGGDPGNFWWSNDMPNDQNPGSYARPHLAHVLPDSGGNPCFEYHYKGAFYLSSGERAYTAYTGGSAPVGSKGK